MTSTTSKPGHSKLPPSSSEKWLKCHGWLKAVKGLPDKSSSYAEEGTEAHSVLECSIRLGLDPADVTQDASMSSPVASVIGWLERYIDENPGTELYPERRVQWGSKKWMTGSADLILVSDDALGVIDYKHGKGVRVDPEHNSQGLLYLNGAVRDFGLRKKMFIGIAQPRITKNEPVRLFDVTDRYLIKFERKVKHAVQENILGGKREAGEHCRHWCKAAPTCRTFAEFCLEIASKGFND